MNFFRRPYRPLNRLEISVTALRHNLQLFRELAPHKAICPVLKSNAYGHGLTLIAKALDREKCPYFIVDSLYEAYELKKAHIQTPILVLGHQHPENLKRKSGIEYTATSLMMLKELVERRLPFHLEIETGMKRMGISLAEVPEALAQIKTKPKLLRGVFTHFMQSYSANETLLKKQTQAMTHALQLVREAGLQPQWIHADNSAALLKTDLPGENLARMGLALYGINPFDADDPLRPRFNALQPALTAYSTLVAVHTLEPGDALSYGGKFVADRPMQVGIIPFGYYEGLPIALSNRGFVYFQGRPCRILGRVNMNHTFVDLTGLRAQIGDEVEIYSNRAEQENSFEKAAELAGTIPYELLVRLAESIRRITSNTDSPQY